MICRVCGPVQIVRTRAADCLTGREAPVRRGVEGAAALCLGKAIHIVKRGAVRRLGKANYIAQREPSLSGRSVSAP
jgi:hypothetical protein